MSKKNKKDKKSRPLPKPNWQTPRSMIHPVTGLGQSPYLQNPREYPIYGCWVTGDWQESGLTPVVVARKQDNDRIMFANIMVDIYCLGVKDAYTRTDYSQSRFERELHELGGGNPAPCSVELAHELVYGAIEYAEKLGFEPHPDFSNQKADLMLDPPDAHPRENNVTFGKNGKPFYMAGPFDSEIKSKVIYSTLMRTCGEGNFNFMVVLGDMPEGLDVDEDFDYDELE